MRIKRKDGSVFEAPERYVLADGESLAPGGSFQFLDGLDDTQRAVADAARLADAQRLSDEYAAAFRACFDPRNREPWRAEYIDRITTAWQRPGSVRTEPAEFVSTPTADALAAGKAAVAQAYDEHNDWLTNAWRNR
jgi:hypothetical protein